MRVLISGGGTGGHVFPAIAIADAVRSIQPDAEILFVGALGKLEMHKVPAAGYDIIGLPIRGFQRKWSMQNIKLIFNLCKSLWMSFGIIRNFNPQVVVGVGGYASGPVLRVASWKNKPILIQEQNSYPGITNRIMSKAAKIICVAFEGLEKYFDKNKIAFTGNPVRKDLVNEVNTTAARNHFGLDPSKITVGIFGGSLGARSINDGIVHLKDKIKDANVQWLWQTGSLYYDELSKHELANTSNVKMLPFIDRMDYAYAACDIVVARAGALTLAELCVQAKPSILVPSPNVAEDHQRKNAEALVMKGAAKMILDAAMKTELWNEIMKLINDDSARNQMKLELKKMAKPNAANDIANEILKLVKE
jgi:UDP-N-acetylglucosamine--N-acetylmuramyl-(pentapeptide) pyrophosphoryl-undecaprenol N-acetylglucosamine transferase